MNIYFLPPKHELQLAASEIQVLQFFTEHYAQSEPEVVLL